MPTRRNFLKASTLGATAGRLAYWSGTSAVAAASASKSPNEQPVVAFIGTGIRFHTALGRGATEFGPCAAVCDVDLVQAGRAYQVVVDRHHEFNHPIDIDVTEDYRRVLDRPDVDVVVIATPDHWHAKIAIEAMQAGKDVYCEKPLTLTIREGQQIIQVMKQTRRVVQVGTQQRTEMGRRFATAAAMVRDGRAGKIKRVTTALGGALESGALPATAVPRQLNWEKWLGQAPLVDYREGARIHPTGWGAGFPLSRAHRYFRWWYEYSGGKLTDWGAHHVDCALWALNKQDSTMGVFTVDPIEAKHPVAFVDGQPTQDDQFNTATRFKVRVQFKDGTELMVRHRADDLGFDNGVMFEGDAGRFFVNRGKLTGKPVEELKQNPLPEDALDKLYGCPAPTSHMANFIDCVKSRVKPVSDAETHHRTLSICHAVNIALRLGRKLTYDPQQEEFVGDAGASALIERSQRKGYEINV